METEKKRCDIQIGIKGIIIIIIILILEIVGGVAVTIMYFSTSKKLDKVNKEKGYLEDQNKILYRKLVQYNDKINVFQEKNNFLENSNQEYFKQIDSLTVSNNFLSQKFDKEKQISSNLYSLYSKTLNENQDLKLKVSSQSTEINNLKTGISELKIQLNQAGSQIQDISKKLDKANTNLTNAHKYIWYINQTYSFVMQYKRNYSSSEFENIKKTPCVYRGWQSISQTHDYGFILSGEIVWNNEYPHPTLEKYLDNGEMQWSNTFFLPLSGFFAGFFTSAIESLDNGFIAVGYANNYRDCILKTDKYGYLEWYIDLFQIYGPPSYFAYSIIQRSNGSFIMAGVTKELKSSNAYDHASITQLDSKGNIEWRKIVGSRTQNQNYYGRATSIFINGEDIYYLVYSSGHSIIYYLHRNGDITSYPVPGASGYFGHDFILTKAGYFLVVGEFYSSPWIIAFDPVGYPIFSKTYEGTGALNSVKESFDDGYLISGQLDGIGWILRIDYKGETKWDYKPSDLTIQAAIFTVDGKIALAGKRQISISCGERFLKVIPDSNQNK